MRKLILIVMFLSLTSIYCVAQYKEIPQQQVATKITELQSSSLKDSVLWTVAGFFVNNEYIFSKVTAYDILVNTRGSYFKFDLAADNDSVVVSFVYFIPHYRLSAEQQNDPTAEWAPNEHLCICTAKTGSATIKMSADGFTCAGAEPAWNTPENININCHDTEQKEVFFTKYYALGRQHALQTIPPNFVK